MASGRTCKRNEMHKRDARFASTVLPDSDESHLPATASFESRLQAGSTDLGVSQVSMASMASVSD